mgnify:FL=1
MKKLLILLVFSVSALWSQAQQLEQWTQFYMNEYMINPAVTGADDYYHANALYRNQWVGIQDAPRTYYLSLQGPIVSDVMGLGGAVFSDIVGHTRRTGLQLSYAYHLKISTEYKLSFSLSAGLFQFAVDGGKLNLQNVGDYCLSNGYMSIWTPDFGSGVRFAGDNFHVGIYVPQIANMRAQFFDDFSETDNLLSRHYYLNAGYMYEIDDDFDIEANLLGRYVTPMDMFELQVRGIYQEMVWLGASYRTPLISDQLPAAVGVMAGYKFKNNLTIGYAYDFDIGDVGVATSGSHEIVLGITFSRKNDDPVLPPE